MKLSEVVNAWSDTLSNFVFSREKEVIVHLLSYKNNIKTAFSFLFSLKLYAFTPLGQCR